MLKIYDKQLVIFLYYFSVDIKKMAGTITKSTGGGENGHKRKIGWRHIHSNASLFKATVTQTENFYTT